MSPMTQVIITERGKVRTTWVPTATLIGLPLAPKEAGQ
jgi:hypothetical protein